MTIESKIQLKSYFETGDRPTQAQFANLIDSSLRDANILIANMIDVSGQTGIVDFTTTTNVTCRSAGVLGLQLLAANTTAQVVSKVVTTADVGTAVFNSVNSPTLITTVLATANTTALSFVYKDPHSVRFHGAAGDDSTDDTAAFRATVNYVVSVSGGEVFIPSGTYKLTGVVTADSDGLTFRGEGATSIIKSYNTAGSAFYFGNSSGTQRTYSGISNVRFTAQGNKTAGAAILMRDIYDGFVDNVIMENHFTGLWLTGCTISYISRLSIFNIVPTTGCGIIIDRSPTRLGNDQYLRDVIINGIQATPAESGVKLLETGAVWLDTIGALFCDNALAVVPASGQTVSYIFSQRCAWDTCASYGMYISPATNGNVRNSKFIGDWTSSNTLSGVFIDSTGSVDDLEFIGHRAYNNGQRGFLVAGGSNIAIKDSTFSGNSTSSPGTYQGIVIAGGTNFRISGNRSGATVQFTNSQSAGLQISSSAVSSYIVTGNDFQNNGAGFIDGGASPKAVANNLP